MELFKKGSIPALFAEMVALTIAGMIVWPLLDMFFCAVFTHSEFKYSVSDHIIEPIIFGIIGGIIFWSFDRYSVKKSEKKKS